MSKQHRDGTTGFPGPPAEPYHAGLSAPADGRGTPALAADDRLAQGQASGGDPHSFCRGPGKANFRLQTDTNMDLQRDQS